MPGNGSQARRGQVWLAERVPGGRPRPVLLVQRDASREAGGSVLAAALIPAAEPLRGTAVGSLEGVDGRWAADVTRITHFNEDRLVRPVATLDAEQMGAVDAALRDVLDLPAVAHPFAAPPDPPPLPDPDETWSLGTASGRLEDHPMAQLFGQPPPRAPSPPSHRAEGGVPVAAMLPELIELARRRLHRSASRIEAILQDAAASGRSVDWVAAAVRATSIRGVVQSSLDELAREMSALAAGGGVRR